MRNKEEDPVVLPRRVLIIGLDAATLDLVGPWVDQGHLPNIGCFFSEGALRSHPV